MTESLRSYLIQPLPEFDQDTIDLPQIALDRADTHAEFLGDHTLGDAVDPAVAMDEYATFLRQPNSGVEIDKAAASIRIMLGVYPKAQLCDPALLADSLARL
mgnify:CR=1 FL=1